ncbi:DUF4282 domain-containing protein [Asticcacaulis sp. AND118]|uniref:DUF4282 domain-containing protein n=1 Tax=Asticcacaulis sp. AND118 TaxID=2840468 RepID=UPI001CFFC2B7|nr:DUF4282 domain-containing protein [Asticcacaulis sp. AND118]UDF03966.1 DUF4282 domain-containing protein [Asticcacaulis sp. AND118]
MIKKAFGSTRPKDIVVDLMTFDRLLTKPVIHLIYWAGLALIALGLFAVLGGTVGIAMREEMPWGIFLAIPFLIGGLLFLVAAMLLWRSFCEFYVAIFRIADDLRALRAVSEGALPVAEPAASPVFTAPTETPAAETVDSNDILENPFFVPNKAD